MKYKIYKINENTYKILTNTASYTFTIDRINKLYCKQHVKQQKYDIDKLYMGEFITKQQKYQSYSTLDNWYKHCSHSMINVEKQNLITNEIIKSCIPITQREKQVEIKRSMSEDLLGEKMQNFSVIKIENNLYITSHSLIIDLSNYDNDKLKFEKLKYDEDKDCYVDVDQYNNSDIIYLKNLTQNNVEKILSNIVDRMEDKSNEITQIDITNSGDPINDIIRTKFIEKWKEGYFDKNTNETYEAKGKQIDEYNDALDINIYKIKKRPEDEL